MSIGRIVFLLVLTLGLAAPDLGAQRPRGRDFRISPRASERPAFPDVATAADGSFVAVWKDLDVRGKQPDLVKARLFDAAGRPRSGPILVARILPASSGKPAVAMAPDGRFVVVWQGGGGVENDPYLVFGRRFDAAGRPLGPRFRLANSELDQYEPDVAMASDGSFVTVWFQPDGGVTAAATTDVVFRLFDATGRPRGRALVAIGGHNEQSFPRVAVRPDGSFVVVCQAWTGDNSFYDVKARLFSTSGAPLGDAFLVNGDSPAPEEQSEPAVAVAADGKLAVAWTDRGADIGRHHEDGVGVAVRFYAADATPLGPSLLLNTFLRGPQEKPAVSALPDHGFLVLWASGGDRGGNGRGIFARVFGPQGIPREGEELMISEAPGRVGFPTVSVAPNGRGIAVWSRSKDEGTAIIGRLLAQRR